jgi:hypothetical protein
METKLQAATPTRTNELGDHYGYDGSEVWLIEPRHLPRHSVGIYQRAYRHGYLDASSQLAAIRALQRANDDLAAGNKLRARYWKSQADAHLAQIGNAVRWRNGGTNSDIRYAPTI